LQPTECDICYHTVTHHTCITILFNAFNFRDQFMYWAKCSVSAIRYVSQTWLIFMCALLLYSYNYWYFNLMCHELNCWRHNGTHT
jgi:hypothetical protein